MTRGVFTAATTITASGHNDVWDPPRCRLTNSANISITTSGTAQALTFDTEVYDTLAMHSTSVNTSRITAPADGAGLYEIGACISFDVNATGRRFLQLRVNGVTFIAAAQSSATGAGGNEILTVSTHYRLAVGDYVEVVVTQTSGGALNSVLAASYAPVFYAKWIAV